MSAKDEFWQVMSAYGARIWPTQVVAYALVVALIGWLLLNPGRVQSFITKAFLSVAFASNALLFYLILARGITGNDFGSLLTGALFLLVAVFFGADLFRGRMKFSLPIAGWRRYASLLALALVCCYPVLGLLSGHALTNLIVPGTHPCATTALAMALLTTALPDVDWLIYALLVFFAVPFTPFHQIARFGVYEDAILLAVGIYGLVLLVRHWWRRWTPTLPA